MFLGIDIGTSGVKAVVLDESGAVVGQGTAALTVQRPHPLWSEQDPDAWWRATAAAVQAIDPAARRAVRGIGLAGQMHGATLLGADDRPLRPAILWNDGRSAAQCAALEAAHRARVIHYDIKPHNVILTDGGLVKVIDFGIAGFVQAAFTVARSSIAVASSRVQIKQRARQAAAAPVELDDEDDIRAYKKRRTSSEAPEDDFLAEQQVELEPVEADPNGDQWVDLDAEDADDPLMVSEYVIDIFNYLKQVEVCHI